MKNLETPQMATINEVAKTFGLAKYLVRQLAIQGKIKCIKAGKKYLINVQKFCEYLNECPQDTSNNMEVQQ